MDLESGSRKHLSAHEYQYREEQADDIVRVAAYHRRDHELSVIWFQQREHDSIRRSISTPFERTSNAGSGFFDRLPLELIRQILLQLDICSIFRLRQTALSLRQAVGWLNEYRTVVRHGLNTFCALLRTEIARDVSLNDFYDALCTRDCALCGNFSGVMSLLTWTRCCFRCLEDAPEIQVGTAEAIQKKFHFTQAEVRQLKSFNTLPGLYSSLQCLNTVPIKLVSLRQAYLISGRPQPPKMRQDFYLHQASQQHNFMGACALPYFEKRTGKVDHGGCCAGCQLALEDGIMNFQAGKRCRDKVYSHEGFLEHFKRCSRAQYLWETSKEGTTIPPRLPKLARRGGFFGSREGEGYAEMVRRRR